MQQLQHLCKQANILYIQCVTTNGGYYLLCLISYFTLSTGSPVKTEASDSLTQKIVGDVNKAGFGLDNAGAPFNMDI